jgi:hypothetical protein
VAAGNKARRIAYARTRTLRECDKHAKWDAQDRDLYPCLFFLKGFYISWYGVMSRYILIFDK